MTGQERLIRDAIAAEADQAVDHRTVLANLRAQRHRRRPIALIAAAALTAAAATVAVIVPLSADRSASIGTATQPTTPRTVLLIGLDGAAHADSVVLTRLGPDGAANAASLPRDSLVDIPGVGRGKLNSAYTRAHEAARAEGRDGDAAGARALVDTVEALTGVEVDHYAAVDMAAFGALSDAVGGVDVCLLTGAHDEFSGVDLPPGRTTLRGDQALAFLRQRHGLPNGDLDRIVRHQAFLHALTAKVTSLRDPAELAELVEAARADVRTDPDLDLLEFARQVTATGRAATIPFGGVADTDQGQGLTVDPAAVRAFAAEFFADRPAGPPARTSAKPLDSSTTPLDSSGEPIRSAEGSPTGCVF